MNAPTILECLLDNANFPDLRDVLKSALEKTAPTFANIMLASSQFLEMERGAQINAILVPIAQDSMQVRLLLYKALIERCDERFGDIYSGPVHWRGECAKQYDVAYCSYTRCIDYLLSNAAVDWTTSGLAARVRQAIGLRPEAATPKDFLRICGLKDVTAELAAIEVDTEYCSCATRSGSTSITVLHFAAAAIGTKLRLGDDPTEWASLAKSLVQAGADPCYLTRSSCYLGEGDHVMSPLLTSVAWRLNQTVEKTLLEQAPQVTHYWARVMLEAGVDLLKYGSAESSIYQQCIEQNWTSWKIGWSHSICGLIYGANPADWSLELCEVSRMPVLHITSMPGSWSFPVSQTIFWIPDDEEELHLWRPGYSSKDQRLFQRWQLSHRCVLFRRSGPCSIEDVVSVTGPSLFEDLVAGTQDDGGAKALLVSRRSKRLQRRSTSAPPPIHRNRYAYLRSGCQGTGDWLGSYHLCPRDGIYRPCENLVPVKFRTGPWTGDCFYNCARCLKSW